MGNRLLKTLIMGKYTHITHEVVKDTIYAIKCVDEISYDKFTFLLDSIYEDKKSGLLFDLHVHAKHKKKNPTVEASTLIWDGEDSYMQPEIDIWVEYNIDNNYKDLEYIYSELVDVVRHEIEHITQRGFNEKMGKGINFNKKRRDQIESGELPIYKYYLLKDEVDANIQGLWMKSKVLKKDFQIVIDRYLSQISKKWGITKEQKKIIYNKWKKRISEIGGIPKLK